MRYVVSLENCLQENLQLQSVDTEGCERVKSNLVVCINGGKGDSKNSFVLACLWGNEYNVSEGEINFQVAFSVSPSFSLFNVPQIANAADDRFCKLNDDCDKLTQACIRRNH